MLAKPCLQEWDATGEYFLLLVLTIVTCFLVHDLMVFMTPLSPCTVEITEEEPVVPAMCRLDGYAAQHCLSGV